MTLRLRACALALAGWMLVATGTSAQPASPSQPGATPASTSPAKQRPKIGLVLSGGGARGAAHIGVLKVLEELRVPVDVIAGTSMGSIVGAAYATGLTIPEMEEAVGKITTKTLFTDKPPRADQTIRQKSDDLSPFVIPELGIGKDGIALPKGFVTGVALEGELRKLVQVTNARSFDELPIPFRAIATDIGTGEMVVLKEGSVVQAIRASMSVPGAVAPVTIGKRQLVDGGLTNNLPIDIARSMGAEVIIAVNLGTPLLKPEEITSVLSVTFQMINILTEQNVNRSLKDLRPEDILIIPELGNFSSSDFDNLIKTVSIGEAAARKASDRLRALSLPPEQYAELRKRQSAPSASDPVIIQAIRIEGTERVSPEVVLQALRSETGKPLDRDTIDLDMRRVYGRGYFENVNYTVEDGDGKATLVILVKEKPERDFFRFGLELDANLGKQADFNLYASHRRKWMNAWGGEWRNDVVLGSDVLLATEFYQPIGPSQYFFVSPQLRYSITPWYLYQDTFSIAQYQDTTWTAQLDLGANIIEYGEVRVGALAGRKTFELQSGLPIYPTKLSTRHRRSAGQRTLRPARQPELPARRLSRNGTALFIDFHARRGRHVQQVGGPIQRCGDLRAPYHRRTDRRWRQYRRQRDTHLRCVQSRWIPQPLGSAAPADQDRRVRLRTARLSNQARRLHVLRGHVPGRFAGSGPGEAAGPILAEPAGRPEDQHLCRLALLRCRLPDRAAVRRLRLLGPRQPGGVPVPGAALVAGGAPAASGQPLSRSARRYWIASATCCGSSPSASARSAIVRATFSTRW